MSDYFITDLNIHDLYKNKFTLENVCETSRKLHIGFSVLAYSVKGDINIGKIMRTCELTGCQNFIIYGNKCYDRRYTHGSQHYINTYKYRLDEISFDEIIKKFNVTPVFVEQGGQEYYDGCQFWKQHPIQNPLFVFGNESEGIPKFLLKPEHLTISLPQCGFLRSYNVGVTSGIILHDYYRFCMLQLRNRLL